MRPLPNTSQNSSSESLKKLNTFHVNEAHAQRPLPNSPPLQQLSRAVDKFKQDYALEAPPPAAYKCN